MAPTVDRDQLLLDVLAAWCAEAAEHLDSAVPARARTPARRLSGSSRQRGPADMIRIYTIIEGVLRKPLADQGEALKIAIAAEKPYSIRRKELERLHVEVVR